jgi:TolA-binding protein
MKIAKIFQILIWTALVSGCGHLQSFFSPTEEKAPGEKEGMKSSSKENEPGAQENDKPGQAAARSSETVMAVTGLPALSPAELELKIAKLWARVDGLEHEVLRQKERTFLLEKGLMTGIVPNELLGQRGSKEPLSHDGLKESSSSYPDLKEKDKPAQNDDLAAEKKAPANAKSSAEQTVTPEVELAYRRDVAKAQSAFDGQQYGNAVTLFEKIGSSYPQELTEGNHAYWVALSWFYLKNYDIAGKKFREFLAAGPGSPFVPRAKYYLAKTEFYQGFKEKSVKQLSSLIKEHPDSDMAETARWEIKKIKEEL